MESIRRPRTLSSTGPLTVQGIEETLASVHNKAGTTTGTADTAGNDDCGIQLNISEPTNFKICRRCLAITRSRLLGVWSLARMAALLHAVALTTAVVSLVVPYWEDWPDTVHGDIYSGLWWFCVFGKCSSTFHVAIEHWLLAVEVLMSLALLLQLCSLACLLVQLARLRLGSYRRWLSGVSIGLTLLAVVVSSSGVLVYGQNQGFHSGTLAWGFYTACSTPFILLPALVCTALLLRKQIARRDVDKLPILRHSASSSASLDSFCNAVVPPDVYRCKRKTSSRPPSPVTSRDRADSEVRMRTTSVTALMSRPESFQNLTELRNPSLQNLKELRN